MGETQKAKIARLEKELEKEKQKVQQARNELDLLYAKLYELYDKADDAFAASPHFRQLTNENETLKLRVSTLENRLKLAHNKINDQVNLIEKGGLLPRNARKAGRKPKFNEAQINQIIKRRESGTSTACIAQELGCSVGLIYKLLRENK